MGKEVQVDQGFLPVQQQAQSLWAVIYIHIFINITKFKTTININTIILIITVIK